MTGTVFLHYKYGQTYGKWLAGVEVLDISESKKLTLHQAVYRESFYLFFALIGLLYYGFLLTSRVDKQNILADYSNFANNPIFFWTLIELNHVDKFQETSIA